MTVSGVQLQSADRDRISRRDLRHDGQQILLPERDAALGRAPIVAGEVQEDSAAGALQHRIVVVADDDDEIVEVAVEPQAFVARGIGQADRLVVGGVGGIVAPAVGGIDVARRQARLDVRDAVGTVEQAAEREAPNRGAVVAFAFVGDKARAAERARKRLPAQAGCTARLARFCCHDQVHGGTLSHIAPAPADCVPSATVDCGEIHISG